MESLGFIASVVSLAIGIGGGVLSIFFYMQAQAAERRTAVALAKIEAQTDVLQRITGRHLGKLIDRVTSPHPELSKIIDLMTTGATHEVAVQKPRKEVISKIIVDETGIKLLAWGAYYCTGANLFAQILFESELLASGTDNVHFLDRSVSHYKELTEYIAANSPKNLSSQLRTQLKLIEGASRENMQTAEEFRTSSTS